MHTLGFLCDIFLTYRFISLNLWMNIKQREYSSSKRQTKIYTIIAVSKL